MSFKTLSKVQKIIALVLSVAALFTLSIGSYLFIQPKAHAIIVHSNIGYDREMGDLENRFESIQLKLMMYNMIKEHRVLTPYEETDFNYQVSARDMVQTRQLAVVKAQTTPVIP